MQNIGENEVVRHVPKERGDDCKREVAETLVILEGLTGGKDFAGMDEQHTISINRIFME